MINNIVLMGRLTYEPEVRVTTSGVSVSAFQIACDRQYQSKTQERQTDFIDCIAWRNSAEFLERYFHKGDMIAVQGTLETNNYTDKDGNRRKSTQVNVNQISFCGSKSSQNNGTYQQPAPTHAAADNSDFEEIIDDDDDLPF